MLSMANIFNVILVIIQIYPCISCTERSLVGFGTSVEYNHYGGGIRENSGWRSYHSISMPDGNTYTNFIVLPPLCPYAYAEWNLNKAYRSLTGILGLVSPSTDCSPYFEGSTKGDSQFKFYLDSVLVLSSHDMLDSTSYQNIAIDVTNANTLRIETKCLGSMECDHSVIAIPMLLCYPPPTTQEDPSWLMLELFSRGFDSIDVDGLTANNASYIFRNKPPNLNYPDPWRRGHHVVIFDEVCGYVVDAAVFDTQGDEDPLGASFLNGYVASNHIVAVVTFDSAYQNTQMHGILASWGVTCLAPEFRETFVAVVAANTSYHPQWQFCRVNAQYSESIHERLKIPLKWGAACTLSPTEVTVYPTIDPTSNPTTNPTVSPTYPTMNPSYPTIHPTSNPTMSPTLIPSKHPTTNPTFIPSTYPTNPTKNPTINPTKNPTINPTKNPTINPTKHPTINPTLNPTINPTSNPTMSPTLIPSKHPTTNPTFIPSTYPTNPTKNPTINPTKNPTINPTKHPTINPTLNPTINPTSNPTMSPSRFPTKQTTKSPTKYPTRIPIMLSYFPTINTMETQPRNKQLDMLVVVAIIISVGIVMLVVCIGVLIYKYFMVHANAHNTEIDEHPVVSVSDNANQPSAPIVVADSGNGVGEGNLPDEFEIQREGARESVELGQAIKTVREHTDLSDMLCNDFEIIGDDEQETMR
eukprot:283356_1